MLPRISYFGKWHCCSVFCVPLHLFFWNLFVKAIIFFFIVAFQYLTWDNSVIGRLNIVIVVVVNDILGCCVYHTFVVWSIILDVLLSLRGHLAPLYELSIVPRTCLPLCPFCHFWIYLLLFSNCRWKFTLIHLQIWMWVIFIAQFGKTWIQGANTNSKAGYSSPPICMDFCLTILWWPIVFSFMFFPMKFS